VVYVMELADGTFRSSDDVRVVLGLPCLGLVARVPPRKLRATSVEEYVTRRPHSVLAEQLRALHAGLSLATERPRVVAVTAARAKEGKTTLTHALACLAALNGERVIVVDCDIRHAGLDRDSKGLVECLREQATLAEAIRQNPGSGADFLPSGGVEPNGLGLLMSGKMAQVLQTLRHDYDLVLLDTPPAEVITDARVIAGLADATLFFVHWRATSRAVALHALKLLEEAHANVVGAALTQVDIGVHLRSGYADAEAYHPRYAGYFRE
jgi:capsular exopolysaccharide synthesis family protein